MPSSQLCQHRLHQHQLEQQTTLNGIIIDKGVDNEKFLKYMGVAALAEIKAQDYKKAIEALKLAKGAKAA